MAFVPRLRGNIITCSKGADGWIVCMCPVDRDVPAGSKPRGVVSWDVELCAPERELKLSPFWEIYHRVERMAGEIERDTCVAQICTGTTAVKRSSS